MSAIPNVKDYVRLCPPWASIDPERSPVLKWHATRGGAVVSALNAATTYREYRRFATRDVAIARLLPNGDLRLEQTWRKGDVV